MVIEWLKIQVSEPLRETFIQKDEEIWTATLSQHPGFMGKEVWLSTENPTEVVMVIQWADFNSWEAVPTDVLEATEKRFSEALGANTYQIVESSAYQLRKFARKITP